MASSNNDELISKPKGVLPVVLVDRNRFPIDNEYGITLITLDEGYPMHKHFYNEWAQEVVDFCIERRIAYCIKEKTITEE